MAKQNAPAAETLPIDQGEPAAPTPPAAPAPVAPDPNCFAVSLPEPLANWVRETAEKHATTPASIIASTVAAAPLGGDVFTVPLKGTEADWVRNTAALRGQRPADVIRQLVAQARAGDATKGGTIKSPQEQALDRARASGLVKV